MPKQLTEKEVLDLQKRLKPGTSLHDNIVKLVSERFQMSAKGINQRYDNWRKAENLHLAYVDTDEVDSKGKKLYPFARSIVVPYTYAMIQTRLTYFFLALASREPIVPLVGTGPKDIIPAKLMEVVNSYQIGNTGALTVLYCWLQDADRYGMGVIKNLWYEVREMRRLFKREPVALFGVKLFDRKISEMKRTLTYEGNLPSNISPYNFYPDPRVNVSQVKDYEFVGHKFKKSYNYLFNRSLDNYYFNIDAVKEKLKSSSGTANITSVQKEIDELDKEDNKSNLSKIVGVETTTPSGSLQDEIGFINNGEMFIRIIPDDLGLAKRKNPEEWLFTIANNDIVIKAEPSEYNEFPYYVIESNHDYASPFNLGTPEMAKGLQDILSWLFNSHYENVRKVVNDTLVVDPSLIEIGDLLRGGIPKIIRMKKSAYGMGMLDKGVKQLTISDITRQHITDAQIVISLLQKVTAATDNLMGTVEEVKRTATETSSTLNLATARLKLTAKLYALLGFVPFFKDMTFNNQAFLSEGRYFEITDNLAQELGYNAQEVANRIFVEPEQLYGFFDFKMPNIDLPIDKVGMAKVWREIIADVVSDQTGLLMKEFNVVPMFAQVAYNLGISNISDFRNNRQPLGITQPNVIPDEALLKGMQSGQYAPVNDVVNGKDMINDLQNMFGAQLMRPSQMNGVPSVGERRQ